MKTYLISIYNGEAYIATEELNNFLETAQELQVKGLQSIHEFENIKTETESRTTDQNRQGNKRCKNKQNAKEDETNLDSIEELISPIKTDVALIEENLLINTNLELQIEWIIEKMK